ncbi:lipoyl domain-containing protein [Micromonospora sp. NPDC049523]|uniref:lipoyl domain-containing protein n=1 Tax=Micromonospora sp. NPDC049523 TaxID=3155921 RepID=UPI00344151CF
MADVVALVVTAVLAAIVTFGKPLRPRRPTLPVSWSEGVRRWWFYPVVPCVAVDVVAHEHLHLRTLLVMCGLLAAAAAASLLRGAPGRPPTVTAASVEDTATMAVVLPWLGGTVSAATVTSVRKTPGEAVRVGEAVCEISTDKVDIEVSSELSGTVVAVLVQPPVDIAVGEPIMLIRPA